MNIVAQTLAGRHNDNAPCVGAQRALKLNQPAPLAREKEVPNTLNFACLLLRGNRNAQMPGTVCPKCRGPKTARQGYCPECNRAHIRAWRAVPENLERHRLREAARRATPEWQERARLKYTEWFAVPENREISRLRNIAYAAANPDKVRVARLKYNTRLEVKERQQKYFKERQGEFQAKAQLPENKAKRNARLRAYYQQPGGNLRRRMSTAVRSSLKGPGKSATWPALVGYTVAELRQHIERQFVRGMGWQNMPKWHIDHIVPLSSFRFETADDPEFKAAWALTNLRPLWGPDNIRKQAKRELLV